MVLFKYDGQKRPQPGVLTLRNLDWQGQAGGEPNTLSQSTYLKFEIITDSPGPTKLAAMSHVHLTQFHVGFQLM